MKKRIRSYPAPGAGLFQRGVATLRRSTGIAFGAAMGRLLAVDVVNHMMRQRYNALVMDSDFHDNECYNHRPICNQWSPTLVHWWRNRRWGHLSRYSRDPRPRLMIKHDEMKQTTQLFICLRRSGVGHNRYIFFTSTNWYIKCSSPVWVSLEHCSPVFISSVW